MVDANHDGDSSPLLCNCCRVTAVVGAAAVAGAAVAVIVASVLVACATRVAILNKSAPAAVHATVAAAETHTTATCMTAIVTASMSG